MFTLECEYTVNPSPELAAQIRNIEEYLLDYIKPRNFDKDDNKNAVITHEKEYENMVSTLESENVAFAGKLALFRLYSKIEYLNVVAAQKSGRNNLVTNNRNDYL